MFSVLNVGVLSCRLAGEWLPKVTLHPIGTAAVGIIELCLVAAAIYGCMRVKMDFRLKEWFVPDDSYLKSSINLESNYFFGNQIPIVVYTKEPADGSNFFYHQDEYENLISAVKHEEYISDVPSVTCW